MTFSNWDAVLLLAAAFVAGTIGTSLYFQITYGRTIRRLTKWAEVKK